ncbi:MAG TPA: TetR/AcrR family transcriptional regulator [Acidimicrobiales bacterium]|nr:TetR/AcrR family transcriptional regulator [Acidimicrobiales bacterium]
MHPAPVDSKPSKTAFSVWGSDAEARALVQAAMSVLRRSSAKALTVSDVLEEAGLSTRAFYRHFHSKDELILAVYQYDNRRSIERLRSRIAGAASTLDALAQWVEGSLALGFAPRQARRTMTLWREGGRIWAQYPGEYKAIVEGLVEPLTDVLERGRQDGTFPCTDPQLDALTIHAVVWRLIERRLGGDTSLDPASAAAYVLRFCLPALTGP